MIKSDEIRNRLTWADEKPDKEIMEQYTHRLLAALREIPEDEEESSRLPEAVVLGRCCVRFANRYGGREETK